MSAHTREDPAHIPTSTYRLQLNRQFNLDQAAQLADYLSALGIGDCYLSPFLTAAEGSMHGYDVITRHNSIPKSEPREDLERCANA